MPKTDPEIITLGAVSTVTVTVPSTLNSATVQSIEGGTVTRAGSALTGGETLHAGETLTFAPVVAGGTTYLNARVDNAEFSGHYDDLDGKPEGTGGVGPAGRGIASITVANGHLTGTYSDGTAWDAGALPAGSGGGLDAEAVQDIVGQMLGETQGHYDDATGTYTINLPAGSSMTDEQVQDIVGALVKAGANTTVAYDDAAGTLTISAASGGQGPQGEAGRGIASITVSGGHLTGTYSDGTPWDAGVLPGGGSVTSVNSKTGAVELNASDVGLGNVTNNAQVKRSEMGVASGVATLGADGKVPASQLPAATGGTGNAAGRSASYRYWRLNITANGGGERLGISELVLRDVPGGPNIALNKPISANSEETDAGFLASAAVDGTIASGNGWIAVASMTTGWLIVDLLTTQTVREYAVAGYPTSNDTAARSPKSWTLDGSSDGTTWTPVHSVSNADFSATPAEVKTYALQVATTDAADMPRVTAVADVPNGGQALLTSPLPPRWVYRHTDGTLYYGPAYSTTP